MTSLNREVVLEELQPIFREALDEPGLVIMYSSNATNTPNWDSLAHITLIDMVQSHFKVRFALGELQYMKEVRDLVELIVAKAAKA